MNYVQTNLFKVQLLAQLALSVLFYYINFTTQFQTIFTGILLCLVGIPHGANDYLYQNDKSISGLIKFLAVYISCMLVYFALWWFRPLFALILFFIISIHHFGQSNFGNKKLWYFPSLFWGIWILLFPILLHYNEAVLIFNQMIEPNNFKNTIKVMPIVTTYWQLVLASIFALLYIITIFFYEKSNLFSYLIQFILVSIWIALTPLIFGFIIIFCLWHSMQSVQHQLIYYKTAMKGTTSNFLKAVIPFSLMALLFLGLYVFFRGFQLSEIFILLSLITLPHVIIMHRLHSEHAN